MNEQTRKILKDSRQTRSDTVVEDIVNNRHISLSPLLLTAEQAAQLLGFTKQFFYQLQASGSLGPQALYFGKRARWSVYELREWIKAGCPPRERWLAMKQTENILT
jgi:predicted DNA-binding transcriptional regulator AlpA